MLSIIVLEDNEQERNIIEKLINNRISINPTPDQYDAKIVLSSANPKDVIDFISNHEHDDFLAYLDIDLKTNIDGIEVASQIKNTNNYSQIVFVTADANALRLTIQRHVEPLDYITKDKPIDDLKNQVYETIDTAYKRYQTMTKSIHKVEYFVYNKFNNFTEKIPLNQLFYLTIYQKRYKKLRAYSLNKVFDCDGTLKYFANEYKDLVYADRQTLINLQTVKSFDEKNGIVYFDDEQQISYHVAVRRRRNIFLQLHQK